VRWRGLWEKIYTLLWRDRNMFIGTLVVPIVILGMQLAFNPAVLRDGFFDYRHIAAMAFGVAAYVLMFSAFSVLSAEGQALWLLYCAAAAASAAAGEDFAVGKFCVSLCGGAAGTMGGCGCRFRGCLCGYRLCAGGGDFVRDGRGALGFLGPIRLIPMRREGGVRRSFIRSCLLAAAIGAGGIYVAPGNWHRLVILIVVGFLAYGLWEKVRERLPYLLDPVARPASRISRWPMDWRRRCCFLCCRFCICFSC
jgi:ABC-2 type transport system permease protein